MLFLWKTPVFIIGFVILSVLLITSFAYEFFIAHLVEPIGFLYDDQGKLIDAPPYSPAVVPPLGTDLTGASLLWKSVQGVKYTFFIALSIALIQIVASFCIAIFYEKYSKKAHSSLEGFAESSYYIPAAVVAIFLLRPSSFMASNYTLFENLMFQCTVILVIGLPPLIVMFSKEIRKVMNQEFILCSRTLGASGWNLYKRHIIPTVRESLVIQFSQKIVQTLILTAHMAFFGVFIGGSVSIEVGDGAFADHSLTNELSAQIATHYGTLMHKPWIAFAPLLFFTLLVLSINFITLGIQKSFQQRKLPEKKSIQSALHSDRKGLPVQHSFDLLNEKRKAM